MRVHAGVVSHCSSTRGHTLKAGFHPCFSRTRDVWKPMLTSNPSLCNKSLRARSKVARVELLRGVARLVPRCAVDYRNRECRIQKRFSVLREKKSKTKEQFYNNNFRKVTVYNAIPDALSDLHTSK